MQKLLLLVAAASGVFPLALHAADAPAAPAPEKSPPPAKAAPASGVQKMAVDFSKQRDAQLTDRKVLLEKLRTAKTEEEKQALLAELRRQQQQRQDEQREAARQRRDQLRETRK